MNKNVLFGKEAREILQKGVNILCNAVKITLGPKGRNAIIVSDYMNPRIINDGVTIAREIELENEFDNIGASIVKEAAIKTNELVGDGTTTSLVLLQNLFNSGIKLINEGYNPIKLKEEIKEGLNYVVEYIEINSKKDITIKDIEYVATISSEDNRVGKLISEAIKKIGKNGNIILEDNVQNDIILELINGMEIKNGYISNNLLSENKNEEELSNVSVYIINKCVSSKEEIDFINYNANVLLLCEDATEDVIEYFTNKNRINDFKTMIVKLPLYGEKRKELIKDISIFCNRSLYNNEECGRVNVVKVYKNKTIIINENLNEIRINERIDFIKKEMHEETSEFELELLEERISNLMGKTALIKVGAPTELEKLEKKMRIEDAICSVKSSIKNGISFGGGLTYYYASKYLKNKSNSKGSNILSESLLSPLKQILYNNGKEENEILNYLKTKEYGIGYDAQNDEFVDMISNGIIDSSQALIESLKVGTSITTMLLTSDVIVINKNNKKDTLLNTNESL